MSVLTAGLILTFLFFTLFALLLAAITLFFPKCLLGKPVKTVLNWVPPFLGGQALRDWAAISAERLAQKRLANSRTGETASQLARDMEEAAMHAMLPFAESADLNRIVACPESGQGLVGVTAPEVLSIAAHIRKEKSRAEQRRIYESAVKNATKIATQPPGDSTSCPPCALQGANHVCCVFAQRPLRCRPLHAILIANELGRHDGPPVRPPAEASGEFEHERIVAQGIEDGMTQALKSAGLDANRYELNSALATALEIPDAAERWARGEDVFHKALNHE